MATINYQPTLQPQFSVQFTLGSGGISEQDPPPPPSSLYGVDLAAHLRGLTVIYRDPADADVKTSTTYDYGAQWYTATVATDAGGYGIAPSLAVSRHEDLFAAWHDGDDAIHVHRSYDYAETWEEITTDPALTGRYPRLLITGDRAFLLYYDTGDEFCKLYGSSDHYETLTHLADFATSEQVNGFGMDRRGRLHVLAEDAGTVVQYTSWDGVEWEGPDSLIGGREGPPGCAYWLHAGAVLAWDTGDQLQLYRTDSGFIDIAAGPFAVTAAYPQQSPGICFDRRGYLFIALQAVAGFSTDDVSVVGRVVLDMPDISQLAIDEEP